jgi:hypothetical protein
MRSTKRRRCRCCRRLVATTPKTRRIRKHYTDHDGPGYPYVCPGTEIYPWGTR